MEMVIRHLILMLLFCVSCTQASANVSPRRVLRSQPSDLMKQDAPAKNDETIDENHRRLNDGGSTNSDGPWDFCMYLEYELCEAYLLSQAPDIYIVRVYPGEYDYHRIVILTDNTGIVSNTPSRG